MTVNTDHLNALGASARTNEDAYQHEGPDAALLETFEIPKRGSLARGALVEKIVSPEFTSLCPLTGQPDFATIEVWYRPADRCIESKSYKLYLGSYRNHGSFHEEVVSNILHDLVTACDPLYMVVVGRFTPRGGIPFEPRAEYSAQGHDETLLQVKALG